MKYQELKSQKNKRQYAISSTFPKGSSYLLSISRKQSSGQKLYSAANVLTLQTGIKGNLEGRSKTSLIKKTNKHQQTLGTSLDRTLKPSTDLHETTSLLISSIFCQSNSMEKFYQKQFTGKTSKYFRNTTCC